MKKVIFTIATGIFALATIFNMNMAKSSIVEDVSLVSIVVLAQANGESSGSGRWQTVYAHGTKVVVGTNSAGQRTETTYVATGKVEYHTGTGETRNDTTGWRKTTVATYN